MPAAKITKSTPILMVDAIEPSLPFWQERLGFERTTEVPDGDRLGFAILTNGTVELMYQTFAMLKKDSAARALRLRDDKSLLFVEVDDLEAIADALSGFEISMQRRETFYGSTEIGYCEPGGHFVTFAQFKR